EGIRVRGRGRESELVETPPHPTCFAALTLRSQVDLSPHAGRGGACCYTRVLPSGRACNPQIPRSLLPQSGGGVARQVLRGVEGGVARLGLLDPGLGWCAHAGPKLCHVRPGPPHTRP